MTSFVYVKSDVGGPVSGALAISNRHAKESKQRACVQTKSGVDPIPRRIYFRESALTNCTRLTNQWNLEI
jgi:hypothetical protein